MICSFGVCCSLCTVDINSLSDVKWAIFPHFVGYPLALLIILLHRSLLISCIHTYIYTHIYDYIHIVLFDSFHFPCAFEAPFRKSLSISSRVLSMFSLTVFKVSRLKLRPLIYSGWLFVQSERGIWFYSSAYDYHVEVFLTLCFEEGVILQTMYIFETFVKSQVPVSVWACVWTLYNSIDLCVCTIVCNQVLCISNIAHSA